MGAPALSIVIPVFNEAAILAENLGKLIAYVEGLGEEFELVVVDDGSSDGSLEHLTRMASEDGRMRVERLPENRGKGAAVRRGVLAAGGERVLFMDADLSTPLTEIPGFLGALDSGYEVVIGNRRAPGSEVTRHQPWLREKLGRGFTVLTRVLLAPGVHDFTCGFKGFVREAAARIFERVTLEGWAFDAEVVVIAQELKLRLVQVPVEWHDEEGTKVRLASAVLRSLGDLFVIRMNRVRGRYQ